MNRSEAATIVALIIVLAKMGFSLLTFADCIVFTIIVFAIQVTRVVSYKYPPRPDLYKEFQELKEKTESIESDVTGLKLEKLKR